MKGPKKPIVVLDIEFLAKQTSPNKRDNFFFPYITEIGAVKYNPWHKKIDGEFHTYCKIPPCAKLSALDKEITHISEFDVENAPIFSNALKSLNDFCDECDVYAWGTADYSVLSRNAKKCNDDINFFIHDAQQIFQKRIDSSALVSVSNALIYIGEYFEGQKHSALQDAYNEMKILKYVLEK